MRARFSSKAIFFLFVVASYKAPARGGRTVAANRRGLMWCCCINVSVGREEIFSHFSMKYCAVDLWRVASVLELRQSVTKSSFECEDDCSRGEDLELREDCTASPR